MKSAKLYMAAAGAVLMLSVFSSCTKDDNDNPLPNPGTVTVVKKWEVAMDSKFENPAPANRPEKGTAVIELMSDNSLRYSITVTDLTSSDDLTDAHIHAGDPVTNGAAIIDLMPEFTNGVAKDTITGLRQSLADSLLNTSTYINVHSTQLPDGLVRGQLDQTIELATDLALSGSNVVPAVTTGAQGTAIVRLTTDKKLYTFIDVENLEGTDSLTTAQLFKGETGIAGVLVQDLLTSGTDFGVVKVIDLNDANYAVIKTDPVYIQVNSANNLNGLLRGQIR